MKTISLKLPDPLHAKLVWLAKARKQTKSEVVREAVEQMLNGELPAKPLSALDLAGDLAGCLEGPGDLSTNPKYMECPDVTGGRLSSADERSSSAVYGADPR